MLTELSIKYRCAAYYADELCLYTQLKEVRNRMLTTEYQLYRDFCAAHGQHLS